MRKRVLVAVGLDSTTDHSITYGTRLAARIKSSLVVLAVSPSETTGQGRPSRMREVDLHDRRYPWLDQVLEESQREGVNLEIFLAGGVFIEEVLRFVPAQPSVQFIVMSAPIDLGDDEGSEPDVALKRLHQEFDGEILLVEKAGDITRVSDLHPRNSERETSA